MIERMQRRQPLDQSKAHAVLDGRFVVAFRAGRSAG